MPRNHISGSYFSRIRGAKRLVGPLIATELVRVALCPAGDTRRPRDATYAGVSETINRSHARTDLLIGTHGGTSPQ